ncbi:hypothetical protein B0H17DRAFT_1036092 [Mycena rosella]|uniref:Chitin-binding type-4 domain-containing protein n=1 Tax=Mycena rosella TaxID=1033263 RepID=A0AAD7M957_MYCRO|nr:hypothetical protein B0H17DRAFT_1036092 [Mycena rosella]
MVYVAATFALLALARLPAVLGHARVSSPPIRSPGNNFLQQCGQSSFQSVTGDPTGHIEEQEPVNAGCELTLCRGMLFSDQPSSNVQTVQPSQAMEMGVDCTIPHGGPANVSLIDTTVGGSGAFIGSFLKTFDDFCPTSGPTPADQTQLQYTLPDANTIGNKCQNAGDCVVQLFWATPDFSQNYYYCVDVVMAAAAPPSTTAQVVPPTVVAQPTTVAQPPTVVAQPTTVAAQPTVPAVNAPEASVPGTRLVTSVGGASATGLVANVNGTTQFTGNNANAGRRRARILWF